jgi:hypothetical protein
MESLNVEMHPEVLIHDAETVSEVGELELQNDGTWKRFRKLPTAELLTIQPTDEKLRRIIKRLYENWYTSPQQPDQFYDRAVWKAQWFMKTGYRLTSDVLDATTSIGLYSNVTNHEMKMSDREFYSHWTDEAATSTFKRRLAKRLVAVGSTPLGPKPAPRRFREKKCVCAKCGEIFIALTRRAKNCPKCGGASGASQNSIIGQRDCRSADKCLNAGKKGQPAPAAKFKQYCTDNCAGSDKARQERATSVQ